MKSDRVFCPFRKDTVYSAGRNTGAGYPMEWLAHEEFAECEGASCMMFQCYTDNGVELTGRAGYCKMEQKSY